MFHEGFKVNGTGVKHNKYIIIFAGDELLVKFMDQHLRF